MKKFYYITTPTKEKRGYNIKATIYQHTKEGMEQLDVVYYNTASCRGNNSEVFSFLLENKLFKISKKVLATLTEGQKEEISQGYYGGTGLENKQIRILQLTY